MPLLPPKVLGPLTPLLTSVRVEQVLPGAIVEIFVDGASTQQMNIASSNVVTVPMGAFQLPPGCVVTARWSLGGEVSQPSLPELVLAWPAELGAPVFLSPIHACADWITVGGLYPGATVEIHNGGVLIGGPVASAGAVVQVPIVGSIDAGNRLGATQDVQVPNVGEISSNSAESLPAEEWFPREERPPVPVLIGPIHECQGALLVGGATPGCTVRLHTNGTSFDYDAIATTFWMNLPTEAHAPATFAVSSHLLRCGRESALSPAIGVDPAAPLRVPSLRPERQDCPLAVSVTAEGLTPRSEVRLELRGAGGTTLLGRAGAPDVSATADYWLGDLSHLVPPSPPFPDVTLTERLCALSAESNRAGIHRRAGQQEVPPGFFIPPVECSAWLHVVNASGCLVTVFSDSSDWSVLAYWKLVPSSGWIALNRPLRLGEKVWVTIQAGCVPAHLLTSDQVDVEAAGDLDAVRVAVPVRPGHNRTVFVEHTVPGARVHVFVDGKHRASAWATGSPTLTLLPVYVGELTEESSVTVRQGNCGRIGQESPSVHAITGSMILKADPPSVIRGQTSTITIRARDADFNFEMVSLPIHGPGGVVGYTGQPFTFATSAGTASPIHFTVAEEGYNQGSINVPITAPAPPAPGIFTITSTSAIGVQNQVITEIEWTLMGAGQSIKRDQKPNTTTCVFKIPLPTPPSGSTVIYTLSGKATIEFIQPLTGLKLTRTASVFSVFNGLQGSLVVEWRGTARAAEINISWRPIYNPETGQVIDEVYVFVLNSMT